MFARVKGGDLDGGPDTPVIFSGGVVSAANYAPAPTPLTPGALVSLYGWNLAESSAVAMSAAQAYCGAISNAVGVYFHEYPITPDKILKAIEEKKKRDQTG